MIRVTFEKLRHSKSFWRFTIQHLAAIPIIFYLGLQIISLTLKSSILPITGWFQEPLAWQMIAVISRWILFIPAFFLIQWVCAELELRVTRSQIAAGLERYELAVIWILSNVLQLAAASVVQIMTVFILAEKSDSSFFSILFPQIKYWVFGICFLNFALLSALLFRRAVPSIVFLLQWPLFFEPILGWILKHYQLDTLQSYLPFEVLSSLLPLPDPSLSTSMPGAIGISLFYCLVLLTGIFVRVQKMDI